MITKFTKSATTLCLLALVAVNSGCQLMPSSSSKSSSDTEQTKVQSGASDIMQEQVTKRPNPYLKGRPSIPKPARARFDAAKQAMSNKNWAQAQADLEWLIENHPNLSGPHLNMALLYRQTEQLEKAEAAFKQAIAVNSRNVFAYNQYAVFLREQGRFNEAQTHYLKALDIWPDYPDSHRNLGILYDLFMGKPDQALPYYKRYQSLLDEPDRTIAGWIADTERRVKQAAQVQ